MLVVIGIIGLVAALSLPLLAPMMRTRKLDSAVDTLKSTCILARSKAIQQRKMMCVTLLQQTDAAHGPGIVITDYDLLRETSAGTVGPGSTTTLINDSGQNWAVNSLVGKSVSLFMYAGGPATTQIITANAATNFTVGTPWSPAPVAGSSFYVIPGALPASTARTPYCPHYLLDNYYNNPDFRFMVLKFISGNMGENVRYLEGCQFDFVKAYNPWRSSVSYGKDALVLDNGTLYKCLIANTNSEPPNANWQSMWNFQNTDAWTYIFLPNGQAWTLPVNADNLYTDNINGSQWYKTTFVTSNGTPTGPTILGPEGKTSAGIIVYATTGQVVSQ